MFLQYVWKDTVTIMLVQFVWECILEELLEMN